MQFKGLIRFFSIALIIISIYQLHFTAVVKVYEGKLKTKALQRVATFTDLTSNFQKDSAYKKVYKKLVDSAANTTITYGINGAINYRKAKEQELNLGLDLQGGMNVTLDVKLDDLIRNMSNNSKDPVLNKVLLATEEKKSSSNANYIDLFYETFKQQNPNGQLTNYFTNYNPARLKKGATDEAVLNVIRIEVREATKRTFDILQTRIDQFGVAQPTVNLDENKGVINVELPGNQEDPERVRKYLQATANLQFWEVHSVADLATSFGQAASLADDYLKAKNKVKKATQATPSTTEKKEQGSIANLITAKADSTTSGQDENVLGQMIAQIQYITQQAQQQKTSADKIPFVVQIEKKNVAIFEELLQQDFVKNSLPADVKFLYGMPEKKDDNKFVVVYAIKTVEGSDNAKLEGDNVADASQDFDERGRPAIRMVMSKTGEKLWEDMTAENVGMPIAIVLDNMVYSAPVVNSAITGGVSQISGSFSVQESQELANILKSGKLPAPAKIVQEQIVGPTLGKEAVAGGINAFLVSFLIIAILMFAYYNSGGTVANVSLILNLLFTVGVLSALGASLTAPGIAGLVLTIGMAVDTNVIIFERIKEEITKGSSYLNAIITAYKKSLAPVLDAHVTTLLTAIILFKFGLGPVKGFATTQILGILLSLLCGILISRQISDWWTSKNRHFEYFTKLSKSIFQQSNFKFIEFRKYAYFISILVLVFGVLSFVNGFDEGVEFKGGRSYTIRFDQEVPVEQVRQSVKQVFEGENPVLKTIGDNKQLSITTSYLIEKNGKEIDDKIEHLLYQSLLTYLPTNTSYEDFVKKHKIASMTVLPTISDDLKKGAFEATILSLIIIFIYIFIRFRKWQYSLGTIIALFHDVFVTLIVFSFARTVVPFPLEIDQHFIAAILTVIGFSMNDTVIVFDRIREYFKIMPNTSNKVIINKAINDTLSRTIMTSATVFITLLVLFLIGGEVTKGFAFAMLIGVITGTYSSIFVAAPVLVDFDKNNTLQSKETLKETSKK